MTVHAIIREFSILARLPEFSLNELGVARLRIDDAVDIDFEYDATNKVLHLYSEIARASENCVPEYELLMGANLFLQESVGTTIALNRETRHFVSCVRLDLDSLNEKSLIVQIEKMTVAVVNLRKELKFLGSLPMEIPENMLPLTEKIRVSLL